MTEDVVDLLVDPLLDCLGERLKRVGQSEAVADNAVPSDHLFRVASSQALSLLRLEVVDESVHDSDQLEYAGIELVSLVVIHSTLDLVHPLAQAIGTLEPHQPELGRFGVAVELDQLGLSSFRVIGRIEDLLDVVDGEAVSEDPVAGAQQIVELVDGAHESTQLGFQVDELLSLITSNDPRDQLAALQELKLFLDAREIHGRAVRRRFGMDDG